MDEIDFLPDWYPQARRRRHRLHLHAYATLVLMVGMSFWLLLSARNTRAAQASLTDAQRQLAQSKLELKQLDEQLLLKKQLEVQRQIVSKLGLPIEMSRMIKAIDSAMPKEMSLVDLTIETEEQSRAAASAGSGTIKNLSDVPADRRLRIKLLAVAPSDVDLANFLAALAGVRFFEDVTWTFSRDKSEGGHLMREFNVTFMMNLNREVVTE